MIKRIFAGLLVVLMGGTAGHAQALEGVQFLTESDGSGTVTDFTGNLGVQGFTSTAGSLRLLFRDVRNDASYSLVLEAPDGQDFAIGRYAGAQRAALRSPKAPGLDFSGNGGGCNRVDGWFEIRDLQIVNGAVRRIAVDFRQRCEGAVDALNGALRYNSELPLATARTRAIAGRDVESLPGEAVVLDGASSFARSPEGPVGIDSVSWRQIAGPPVVLDDPTFRQPLFTSPQTPAGGQVLRFELSVLAADGTVDVDEVAVLARSALDPKTLVRFSGDRGDFISGGRSFDFNRTNARLSFDTNFDNGVAARVDGDQNFALDFAAPGDARLLVGAYENAQRFPFQDAGRPGLSVSGDGRGCNTVSGRFDVLQAVYRADGTPAVLAIDFEQRCEGGAAALRGQLRLDSRMDGEDLGGPRARAGADRTAARGALVVLDGRDSQAGIGGNLVAYAWRQLSGPTMRLLTPNRAVASFFAPLLTPPVDLGFELTVTDAAGNRSTDTVIVSVGPRPR